MTIQLVSIFLYGLTSSLHCISMCGPFIGAMNINQKVIWRTNIFYNTGRMISYMIIGLMMGYLSTGIQMTGEILELQKFAAVAAGLFVVMMGLAMVFNASGNSGFFNIVVKKLFTPVLRKISGSSNKSSSVFLFGLFTGLLPCGVLYPAFALAFASGSPFDGTILMAVFFAGTLPALMIFGIGFQKLRSRVKPSYISWVGVLIIIIGIYTVYARFQHDHSGHSGQHNHMEMEAPSEETKPMEGREHHH